MTPPACPSYAGGTVNLFSHDRNKADRIVGHTDDYGAAAMPLTSAQTAKASVLAARYWAAGT